MSKPRETLRRPPPGRTSTRSRLFDLLCAAARAGGLLRLAARLVPRTERERARVLCYHRVARAPGALSPGRFERHLAHLVRHHRPVPASSLARDREQGRAPPPGAVAVTFDDGYRELLRTAVPLLRGARVPATFFVLTGDLPGTGRLRLDGREEGPDLLSGEEIREISGDPLFEVGSHGRRHSLLADLSPEDLREEVAGSREDLRRTLGRAPALFAYPWGAAPPEAVEAVREAGYSAAFVTGGGAVGADTDPLRIPRIHVPGNASVSRLACEALGLSSRLKGMR